MIRLENVTICQGDFCLTDIGFEIPQRGYGILMGPTGCGKTSLLEAICGLRRIDKGTILLGEQDVTHLIASERQIGYVPQDAALFPTMRVAQQIEFGLAVRKVKKGIRRDRVAQLAALLEITPLLDRFPHGLSGGEKQRVSVARALSFRPRLLCLDEPLSALDDETRTRMINLLGDIHRSENVTVLHITHNVSEAKKLGTILFRLQNGEVDTLNGEIDTLNG